MTAADHPEATGAAGTAADRAPPAPWSPGALAVAAVTVGLWLSLVQALLDAPGGPGIEDWLGWADAAAAGPARALMDWWSTHGVRPWAAIYLALDSLAFVPLYAAVLAGLAQRLADGLFDDGPGAPGASGALERAIVRALLWPLAALVAVDLLENALGLWRLGASARLGALPVGALAALLVWRGAAGVPGARARLAAAAPRRHRLALAAAAVAVLALILASTGAARCSARPPWPWGDTPPIWWLGCAAHHGKIALSALLALVLLAALGGWLFGLRLRPEPHDGDADADARLRRAWRARRRGERARLRAAIGDMLVRSRYVLAVLGLLAVLTVVMDQGRDVVHAMAYRLWPPATGAEPAGAPAMPAVLGALGALAAFAASGLALWLLCFACWLWTRSVCMLRSVHAVPRPPDDEPRLEDAWACAWARLLAWAPALLMTLLLGAVMRDDARAAADGAGAAAVQWTLLAMGSAVLLLGARFLAVRGGQGGRTLYYDSDDWADWLRSAGVVPGAAAPDARYHALGHLRPHWLPVWLALGMLGARLVDAMPGPAAPPFAHALPTLVLAVILFALALWLCLFGWLSLLEHHRAIPWVGLLVGVIGVLGLAGLTENHLVAGPLRAPVPPPAALSKLLACSSLAMAALLAGYLAAVRVVQRHAGAALQRRGSAGAAPRLLTRAEATQLGLAVLALWAAVALADRGAGVRAVVAPPGQALDDPRPTPDQALAHWLRGLCAGLPAPGCAGADATALPVTFVSTEGGGIRAAAWTAFALHHLARADPHLLERTFAVSGVSGGAVGAAAFRACDEAAHQGEEPRADCLQRLARTDLLAPLLSAWLMEDAWARVLPSSWCATPGCAILSRAQWFEAALETGAPHLRSGLVASGAASAALAASAAATAAAPHRPYLLLNSTWVESGARAIGSDLRIDPAVFADARDVLGLLGHDLPLSTAAHNAARFPYINPIGALPADPARCAARELPPIWPAAGRRVVCGHLADGGYFDNSGATTTADLLRALGLCLTLAAADPRAAAYPACLALGEPLRAALRARLLPRVLMVRNSADPLADAAPQCRQGARREATSAADVVPVRAQGCLALNDGGYRPERPVCVGAAGAYVDATGPVRTALNAIGTGAAGQLAEARQVQAVRALRQALGGAAAAAAAPEVTVIDLLPDGTRYPLGWHLAPAAVAGLWAQAGSCRLPAAP